MGNGVINMYDKKIVEQINETLSAVELEETKYLSTIKESDKLNAKIAELKEKMRAEPSFEVTQELGNLESGKQFFDESIATFESNYKQALEKHYKKAKNLADSLVRQSTTSDKDILKAKKDLYEALEKVHELNIEVDRIHEEKRHEALAAIHETKLIHYSSELGEYYSEPIEMSNLNTLPKGLSDSIKRELDGQR